MKPRKVSRMPQHIVDELNTRHGFLCGMQGAEAKRAAPIVEEVGKALQTSIPNRRAIGQLKIHARGLEKDVIELEKKLSTPEGDAEANGISRAIIEIRERHRKLMEFLSEHEN